MVLQSYSTAKEVKRLVASVRRSLHAADEIAERDVALKDLNSLIGLGGDDDKRRWETTIPEYAKEPFTAGNFRAQSAAAVHVADGERWALRGEDEDVLAMMYVPSLAQVVVGQAKEAGSAVITGQAALKTLRPTKMAVTVVRNEEEEPGGQVPSEENKK